MIGAHVRVAVFVTDKDGNLSQYFNIARKFQRMPFFQVEPESLADIKEIKKGQVAIVELRGDQPKFLVSRLDNFSQQTND